MNTTTNQEQTNQIVQKSSIKLEKLNVKNKEHQFKGGALLPVLSFFLLWEAVSWLNMSINLINPIFLPAPSMVILRGIQMAQDGLIIGSILSSTYRIVTGYILGSIFAIFLGILMTRFIKIEKWFGPILNMIGPIPALALLPLFIIWFGIGEIPKVLLIAWTTFIPVLTYALDGLKSVNIIIIRSALSLGASNRGLFRKVILPSALPNIFVGLQVSLALAFSALVVSEMMGAKAGLGYLIVDARNFFKISDMFVAIILIGIEYSIISMLLKSLERKITKWRKGGLQDAVE
jgi:sulfonate transport system permease protein